MSRGFTSGQQIARMLRPMEHDGHPQVAKSRTALHAIMDNPQIEDLSMMSDQVMLRMLTTMIHDSNSSVVERRKRIIAELASRHGMEVKVGEEK